MSHGHTVYPKFVRAPSGGWFHTPQNHHVNGLIAFAGFAVVMYGFYRQAEANVINPKEAYSLDTVAKWNEAAKK